MIKKRKHRRPQNLFGTGPDSAVIALMSRYKSDLSKIRPIYFYIYFPTEEDALKAKSELLINEFTVDLDKSSFYSQWLCLASKEMTADDIELTKLRQYFTTLAKNFNGNYDGWETEMKF